LNVGVKIKEIDGQRQGRADLDPPRKTIRGREPNLDRHRQLRHSGRGARRFGWADFGHREIPRVAYASDPLRHAWSQKHYLGRLRELIFIPIDIGSVDERRAACSSPPSVQTDHPHSASNLDDAVRAFLKKPVRQLNGDIPALLWHFDPIGLEIGERFGKRRHQHIFWVDRGRKSRRSCWCWRRSKC